MLRTSDLIAWLEQQVNDPSITFVPGYYVPDMPDRIVIVTVTSGAPMATEELVIDRPTFQVRSRGAQNDPADAEKVAWAVDDAIRLAPFPATLPCGQLKAVARVAGAPTVLGPPDDADRTELTCSYLTALALSTGGP